MLVPSFAAAQADSGVRLRVTAGYEGHYRISQWFPITVTASNDGTDLQGMLEWSFPGQNTSGLFQREIDLPRGARKQVTLSALSNDFARTGILRLVVDGTVVSEERIQLEPLDTDEFVVGVLSSDPALLNSLAAMQFNNLSGTTVVHLDATFLPQDAMLLAGIDALFIHDVATVDFSAEQRAALELWVRLGGQLVVSGGINAERTTPGLADLLPVAVQDLANNVSLASLGQILRSPAGLVESLPESATVSRVDVLPGAQALDDNRLVVARDTGAGRVIFSAFDVSTLRAWTGEPTLWLRILQSRPRFAPADVERWQGQSLLRNVLQLPGLRLPSFGVLLLFIVGYILVIGPLNFLALRRLRRAELAWFTIPVIVVIFVVGTYSASFFLRGNRPQLAQVAIVQGFEDAAYGQATAFVGIFSPRRSTYTLTFPANTLVSEERFISSSRAPLVWTDSTSEVREALVDVSSLRTFIAERSTTVEVRVESSLRREDQQIAGTVLNEGNEPLVDALVVQGNAMQHLGTLQPGERYEVLLQRGQANFPDAVGAATEGFINRQRMLSLLFSSNPFRPVGPNIPGQGLPDREGVYLLAWREQPGIEARINGGFRVQQGLTLYVIRLDV